MASKETPSSRSQETSAAAQSAQIGVKALPRTQDNPDFPGHVGVTWKMSQIRVYRGFRFQVTDLPKAFQSPAKWRDYLFSNRIPGYVENDLMLRDAQHRRPDALLCLEWPSAARLVQAIESESAVGRRGWYSFNPVPAEETHNCVTWAFTAINRAMGDTLPLVRDGRMKLAVNLLLERGARPSTR